MARRERSGPRKGGARAHGPPRKEHGPPRKEHGPPRKEHGPPRKERSRPVGERDERQARARRAQSARKQEQARPPERRVFPIVPPASPAPARAGEWLFTTRAGAEQDLIEELYFLDERSQPRPAGEALVAAAERPRRGPELTELAFARQGFLVGETLAAPTAASVAGAVRRALDRAGAPQPWALDAWVPDSDAGNRLSNAAAALEALDPAALGRWAQHRVANARAAFAENGLYAQVCLTSPDHAAVGAGFARDAPSLAPGGRLRVHVPEAAPSRAAMKLVEALTWLDRAPEPGDLCVDLGAAPGGWTWVLLERRARVIAVDPARLAHSLDGKKGLLHLRADAFRFTPDETDPADWLFCDMAWRPLEAAGLLAKWARRKWARLLVANIKLPMRKKAEHLFRVREILEDAGWTSLRARQLYHDRDEVTIGAVRI